MNKNQPVDAATVAQLVATSLRLAMEVSVLRDRLRTQEALLVQAGVMSAGAIDNYRVSTVEQAEGDAFRRTLIESLAADMGSLPPKV